MIAQTEALLAPQQDGMLQFCPDVRAMRDAHRHSELELNLVVRGTASYLLGTRRYTLRPRTLVWLFAAQEHILLEQSPDFEMWLGVFSPALLVDACRTNAAQTLLSPDPPGHFCRVLPETEAAPLETLLARVAGEEGDARRVGLTYAVLSAWDVFGRAEGAPSGTDIHPAVERAARLVRDEGADALTLGQLAAAVDLSPAYLSALFKAQTGMALTAFRARQRVERFLRLYGAGRRVSMLEAALEAGFGSYPQFHRVFREQMGCGPAEHHRKRLR